MLGERAVHPKSAALLHRWQISGTPGSVINDSIEGAFLTRSSRQNQLRGSWAVNRSSAFEKRNTKADAEAWPPGCNNVKYRRHCHEGGELSFDPEKEFRGISGSGYYAALARATYGHTRREFQHAFEDYGTSTRIRPSQFERNFRAVALANSIYGKVLNTTIDINLSTIGIKQELTIARLHNEFLDWLRRWLARKGVPTLYVWSLEIGKGGALHAHTAG